ncbi:unnamed protein product [Trichobilharzia szidati]|nr:unnamed protein product [Trichobilharzia szidati]
MPHPNIKSSVLPRSPVSSQLNIRSRSNSPTHALSSRTLSSVNQDSQSLSSLRSTRSYPRKGSTLGNANLTIEEQKHLEEVLARFDKFRQIEDARVKQLRQEMIDRQKVRIKNSESIGEGRCNNCNALFVPILQPATQCVNCQGQFCRTCTEKLPNTNIVMCKFCRFETLHKCKLGVWFTEQLKLARACGRVRGVSGPEALRSSMLRIQRESRTNTPVQSQEVNTHGMSKQPKSLHNSQSLVDSGYVPQRTHSWIDDEVCPAGDKDHMTSSLSQSSSLQIRKALLSGEESTHLHHQNAGQSSSECYSPSLASEAASTTERKIACSVTDLRQNKIASKHQKRLDSDTGSRSNLSIASGISHGSSLSIYSERESSYTHGIQISGDLLLILFYDDAQNALRVSIKQARNLAIADKKHNTTNPYVKSYLLPDRTKGSKRKTSHKKETCNPVYDEEFKYHILRQDLASRTLQVSVWHYNALGVNLFLGEILLPLAFHPFDQTSHWYTLGERRVVPAASHLQIHRGEVVLAVKLVPGEAGSGLCEIHVWIKSAKGLSTSTGGKAPKKDNVDPYVKIYLLPSKERSSKQKTKVVRKNNNPEWNQAIIYRDIPLTSVKDIGIEVSIWDHDRFSSNDFLGGCRLNCGSLNQPWMDATHAERSVWTAMMERPNTWVEGTIQLRSNLN